MLLAIDIGNTNTVFGVYESDKLVHSWRLSTDKQRTVDEYGVLVRTLFSLEGLDVGQVRAVIVASVVPPLDSTVAEMTRRYLSTEAAFVTAANAGIPILYDDPSEVGADRIVDAVAVIEKYSTPAVVVDMGTATTFNVITRQGEYQGGLIAPGVEVSASALIERAAKLPRVDIRKPKQLIGQSARSSLESGFFWGYVALVDGLLERLVRELGEDTAVVGTGGMAHFIREESRYIQTVDPHLTLDGLHIVARRLGKV